jgi:hypothetical protein
MSRRVVIPPSFKMEDVVAVAVEFDTGSQCFFLTWGRIQDAVDPKPLEAIVLEASRQFDLGGTPIEARICNSLQDAASAPNFYEALFAMSQRPIPFGNGYEEWRRRVDTEMREGKQLWFLGAPTA